MLVPLWAGLDHSLPSVNNVESNSILANGYGGIGDLAVGARAVKRLALSQFAL